MKRLGVVCIVLMLFATGRCMSDVISEMGVAYKIPGATSQVLWPECTQVKVPSSVPVPRRGGLAGCGGDNPAFLGWPVAWESEWKGPWKVRTGWFHFSHWRDGRGTFANGGDDWEIFSDMVAVTATFNWTKWRQQK